MRSERESLGHFYPYVLAVFSTHGFSLVDVLSSEYIPLSSLHHTSPGTVSQNFNTIKQCLVLQPTSVEVLVNAYETLQYTDNVNVDQQYPQHYSSKIKYFKPCAACGWCLVNSCIPGIFPGLCVGH